MDQNVLQAFTTAKKFSSTFEHMGSTFEVEVDTPDLSGPTPSVWGDWGPVYTFEFDEPRPVRIRYRCESQPVEGQSEIWLNKIYLDSPMLWQRRQEHPLYLRFADPTRGLEFKGYLDQEGQPCDLEIGQLPLAPTVASLLLLQPPSPEGSGGMAMDKMVA